MQNGDRIARVNERAVGSWDEMRAAIRSAGDQDVNLDVERGGRLERLNVKPSNGKIGVAFHTEQLGAAAAAGRALPMPWAVVRASAEKWWGFNRKEKVEFAGPVQIVTHTAEAGKSGLGPLLEMLGALIAYLWPFALVAAAVEGFMTFRRKMGT
jgi:hypothetical protein